MTVAAAKRQLIIVLKVLSGDVDSRLKPPVGLIPVEAGLAEAVQGLALVAIAFPKHKRTTLVRQYRDGPHGDFRRLFGTVQCRRIVLLLPDGARRRAEIARTAGLCWCDAERYTCKDGTRENRLVHLFLLAHVGALEC